MSTYDPRIYIRDYAETDHRLLSRAGPFQLAGPAAELQRALILAALAADPGNDHVLLSGVAQSGSDVLLLSPAAGDRLIIKSPDKFRLFGPDIELTLSATEGLLRGVFNLTGIDANLLRALQLDVVPGAFALSATDLATIRALQLVSSPATYALNGVAANVTKQTVLGAQQTSYLLNGNSLGLSVDRRLGGNVGAFALTGNSAGLDAALRLSGTTEAYTLAGVAADLTYSGAFAFGDLVGSDFAAATSIVNPFAVPAGVSVSVGDLIVVVFAERVSVSDTAISDGLGNTFTEFEAAADWGQVGTHAWYSLATNAGTSVPSFTVSGSAHDAVLAMAVYSGGPNGFNAIDKNPGMVEDNTSVHNTNFTGVLTLAPALVVSWLGMQPGETDWSDAEGFTEAVYEASTTGAPASSVAAGIFAKVVASSSTLRAGWTGTNSGASGLGIATFPEA